MDFLEKAKRKFCDTKRYENSEKYYKTTLGMPRFCLFVCFFNRKIWATKSEQFCASFLDSRV